MDFEMGNREYVRDIEDRDQVSEAILRTVAAISDRPLLDLPPLQESVDVDALDQLFSSSDTIRSFQLEYAGYEVTVEPNCIRICEE